MELPDIDDTPLEVGYTPITKVDIPAEMIRAIAMGMEEPADIAARYGYGAAQWLKLSQWQPFLLTVAAQKAEFEKSGVTFRLKSAQKADTMADHVFVEAMANETSLSQKIAVMQWFARMGELEPKETKGGPAAGEGFSITINLGSQSQPQTVTAATPVTIEDTTPRYDTPSPLTPPTFAPLVDPEFLKELQQAGA